MMKNKKGLFRTITLFLALLIVIAGLSVFVYGVLQQSIDEDCVRTLEIDYCLVNHDSIKMIVENGKEYPVCITYPYDDGHPGHEFIPKIDKFDKINCEHIVQEKLKEGTLNKKVD